MTPDANGLLVFAVRRGNIENRLDVNYNAPKYTSLIAKLRERFGDELTVIGEVADVICGPFGSAIKNSDYRDEGIPLVRITNISKTGYMDYSDLVYISEELGASLSRTSAAVEYPVFVFFPCGSCSFSNRMTPSCLGELMLNDSPSFS